MAWDDLTEEDRQEMARLLRQAIDGESRPVSPQKKRWRAMLAKIEPPEARPTPFPAPKPSAVPSLLYRKMTGSRRRR